METDVYNKTKTHNYQFTVDHISFTQSWRDKNVMKTQEKMNSGKSGGL